MNNILTSEKLDVKINEIKVYKYNIYAEKHFSFGTWTSRQHAFISISSSSEKGWAENIMSTNNPEIELEKWAECFNELKGLTVKEAFNHIRSKVNVWGNRQSEMAEMAIIDLAGKLLKVSGIELLGLVNKKTVPGVFVILSDDPQYVEDQAKWAVQNGRSGYIKVKLFGDLELDSQVVKAVRKVTSKDTFLIGDVNGGYRMKEEATPIDEIAEKLILLSELGLDACEDPAYISNDEWVELQSKVKVLNLIPDYPMRPASDAIFKIKKGMGRIYNIHPGCTASIIDAVKLAHKVRELGAKIMIGDDSLVGPSCTIWQQIAIGLGADWVEAVEKDKESDFFLKAVKDIATTMNNEGTIVLRSNVFGFGIDMEDTYLSISANDVMVL